MSWLSTVNVKNLLLECSPNITFLLFRRSKMRWKPGTELPQAGQLEDPEKNFLSKKRPAQTAAPSSVVSNPRKRRKNRNKNSFSALDAWNCRVFSLVSQEAIHHLGNPLGFLCVYIYIRLKNKLTKYYIIQVSIRHVFTIHHYHVLYNICSMFI